MSASEQDAGTSVDRAHAPLRVADLCILDGRPDDGHVEQLLAMPVSAARSPTLRRVASGNPPVAYLDSSALVKLIAREPETTALRHELAR